jgi:hypothetical protein
VFVRRFPGRAWIVFDTAVGLDVRRRDGVHVCSALDGEGRVPVLRPWECDLRASTDCANHCDRRPLLRGDYSVAYRFHRQYRAGRCKFWVLGVVKRRSCALRAFEQVTPERFHGRHDLSHPSISARIEAARQPREPWAANSRAGCPLRPGGREFVARETSITRYETEEASALRFLF